MWERRLWCGIGLDRAWVMEELAAGVGAALGDIAGQRWAIEQGMPQLAMKKAAHLGGGFGLVCNSYDEGRLLQLCLQRWGAWRGVAAGARCCWDGVGAVEAKA